MLKKRLLILLFLQFTLTSNAQKHFNNWYFGDKAGLDFNTSPPTILKNSMMSTREGCSSISDSSGNLLFYTDGTTVWNKNHDTMTNGFGLLGHFSSTQSALIAQKPNSSDIFYIFTTDALIGFSDSNNGVNYSIVDMSLNGGLGEVITKNILMFKSSNEKITAVSHYNKQDVWIASIKRNSDSIYVYKLTEFGLTGPLIQRNVGNAIGNDLFKAGVGQIKFSCNGKYIAYAESGNDRKVHLMDFDDKTGILSNSRKLINVTYSPYGIEFSPNGKFLYVSTNFPGGIYQIPIDSIKGTFSFDSFAIKLNSKLMFFSGMQLGPDGRIYVAMNQDSFLSVINDPDSPGLKCNLAINSIKLNGRLSYHGLPNCVQSQVYYPIKIETDTTCILDSVHFSIKNTEVNSVLWDFGDGNSEFNNSKEIRHLYNDSGNYIVQAKISLPNGKDTLVFASIRIEYIKYPLFGNDTVLCIGDSIRLDASDLSISNYVWNDGFQLPIRVIKNSGKYRVDASNTYCKASDSIVISYAKKPVVYLGNDTAFCHQFSHLLNAGKDFKYYQWNTGDDTYSITVNNAGTYSVKVLDSLMCAAADTIKLDELKKPKIISNFDTLTCEFVYLSLRRQSGTNYLWNTGDTSIGIKVNKKGLFKVTAINKFCSVSDTIQINLLPKPYVNLGTDTMLCNWLYLSSNETGKYLWSDGQITSSILITRPGTYWLKITRNQCESIDTISLQPCNEVTYYIPNVFSPNADLNNDLFKVYGTNIENVQMEIYNSWGEKIFYSNGIDPVWDGSFMNETCQQGVYCYIIEIQGYNKRKYYLKGTVHLLR
ncbi:MAG: gliding motility-associated C-terminal domain-containing protein [Bacteroidetes bacterium]|nr:gliding motility-associated C-terminal domain-containing protein [Bacteroidota bacterium]